VRMGGGQSGLRLEEKGSFATMRSS
jgi:hypothetical protein